MSDEPAEFHALRGAFEDVFRPPRWRRFGNAALGIAGLSDDNAGVQWSAWLDLASEPFAYYAAVNLEGMKYIGWPVARLIKRELTEPKLLDATTRVPRPDEVEVCWWRDAWQGAGRLPRHQNQIIGRATLGGLSTMRWQEMLQEARVCLHTRSDGSPQRARQAIVLLDGRTVEREVTPHLQFRLALGAPGADKLTRVLRAAQEQLAPLHEFVASQST